MLLTRCAFCAHSNPTGARFCNECGSPLHLAPCAECGAVDDVLSPSCYRCGAPRAAKRASAALPALVGAGGGDAARDREETTVSVAYGDPRVPGSALAPWLATIDSPRGPLSLHDEVSGHTLQPYEAKERQAGAHADRDDAVRDRPSQRAAPRLRPAVAIMLAMAVVALGGYLYLEPAIRGALWPRAPAPSAPLPVEAPSPEPVTTSLPPPRDDAPPLAPAPAADSTQSLPATSEPAAPTDADAHAAPDTRPPAARAERKPPTSPKASLDARETERIIARELGGFAPPPQR